MSKQTIREVFSVLGAAACAGLLIVLAVLTMVDYIASAVTFFILLFCIAALSANISSYYFPLRKRSFLVTEGILLVLEAVLLLASFRLGAAAEIYELFTGSYNLEATSFFIFYASLFLSGLVFGFVIGTLLRVKKFGWA